MPRKKSTSTTKSSTTETKPKQQKTTSKTTSKTDPKTLDVKDMQDLSNKVKDVEVIGDPGRWELLCKTSSKSEGWMKSTKTMQLSNGVLVQVSTQQGDNIAEALTFVPRAKVVEVRRGGEKVRKIVSR